ncbi:ankyrin repeat-containing domain protein [Powellomyces hirtus]|nr:ankyrin repeat-containing domain protein [Powellomyces hirtus]
MYPQPYVTQPSPVYMQNVQQPSQANFAQVGYATNVQTVQQQVYAAPQPAYVQQQQVFSVQPQMTQIGLPTTNVVVISQAVQRPPKDWNHSIFDCFSDCGSCMVACVFPCLMYGMNKRDFSHRGSWFGDGLMYSLMQCVGFSACLGGGTRTGIRAKYNIKVKRFITRKGVPLQCPDPTNGWPILFYAMRYSQNEVVRFLIDAGHDEKEISKDFANNTALMVAANHKNEEAFMMYVALYPQTIHCTNDDGKTALIVATERGMNGIIQVLLDMGAEVNSVDSTGSTPLHHAAAWGYFDTITLLIGRGAHYNVKNKRGWTPFDWAYSVETRDHLQECATAIAEKKPIPTRYIARSSSGIPKSPSISAFSPQPQKIDLRSFF